LRLQAAATCNPCCREPVPLLSAAARGARRATMQRAHGDAAAAAAAAAAAVVPLLQLKRAAQKAEKLARLSRAVELYERALAGAELAQPCDSLIVAALLNELTVARYNAVEASSRSLVAVKPAELTQRSVHLLHARWQAGTLFAPTAEEVAYLVQHEYPFLPAHMCGTFFYSMAAIAVLELVHVFPSLPWCKPAEAEARVQGIYGALRVALEADARGMLQRDTRTASVAVGFCDTNDVRLLMPVHNLLSAALCDEAAGFMLRMRAACGLTAAEETALRRLVARHKAKREHTAQELPKQMEVLDARQQQAAAADAARHGLRRCALPACDAQEPHPKLFKLCGRCRGAAYCCSAHSVEDWKRHKREDGCKAAP
jgi:hypothetical protein